MFLLRDLVSARTWLAMTSHLAGLLVGFVVIPARLDTGGVT
jgi:hypothetical protein